MLGGAEWYIRQACCGTLLGPRACRGERQWNSWQAREKRLGQWVCRPGAGSGGLGRWLVNQHRRRWQDFGPSQRQARELISGPNLGTRAKFVSLSREQSRVLTGLLTGHSTLCRHLHLMGLRDSPLCRKCGVEDETSAHILCRWETLVSSKRAHLGSLLLEPEEIKRTNLEAIWRFGKAVGLLWANDWGTKGRII
jgi:hypothetical protein